MLKPMNKCNVEMYFIRLILEVYNTAYVSILIQCEIEFIHFQVSCGQDNVDYRNQLDRIDVTQQLSAFLIDPKTIIENCSFAVLYVMFS